MGLHFYLPERCLDKHILVLILFTFTSEFSVTSGEFSGETLLGIPGREQLS